jgi:DNA-binding transcriptional ArsR family regulator
VSHQMRTLKSMKLVKQRREGKNVYYSLDDDHVLNILNIALEHKKHS